MLWAWTILAPLACRPEAGVQTIQVRGSDSEVNLVQRLGEAFSERRSDVAVAVTGGGSGVGISALIAGTVDLANSSRAMKPGEKLLALRRDIDPVPTIFAADALTVIVHPDNPVESMTLEELAGLYTGETTAWASGQTVVAYGRQSSSGTYGFFREAVLGTDFGTSVREMNGNAQIVEAVAADPGGVGYVAVGYLRAGAKGVRAMLISEEVGGPSYDPLDAQAVAEGKYPITRPLYQYSDGQPTGALLDFLRFELTEEGQEMAVEMGFYPPIDAWSERNAHLYGEE